MLECLIMQVVLHFLFDWHILSGSYAREHRRQISTIVCSGHQNVVSSEMPPDSEFAYEAWKTYFYTPWPPARS